MSDIMARASYYKLWVLVLGSAPSRLVMWGMSLGLSGLRFSDLENKEVSWIGSGFQTRLNVRIMWVLCQSGSLVNYRSPF